MPWRVNTNIGLPQYEMSHQQATKLLEEQKKYHVEYVYAGATLTRRLALKRTARSAA
jgi:hypothetical protein